MGSDRVDIGGCVDTRPERSWRDGGANMTVRAHPAFCRPWKKGGHASLPVPLYRQKTYL